MSSGESDERAAFEAWFETVHLEYDASVPAHAWGAWQARAALATQPATAERAPCKRCGGTRVVDDGEIDCYPDGSPYLNGPVKCVKDCPVCTPNGRPVGAESKACASVGVEPAKLSRDIKEAIQELGGGSFPDLMEAVDQLAALASPAPSRCRIHPRPTPIPTHVRPAAPVAPDLANLRAIIERVNRKGGLGLDVHEWLGEALAMFDALEKKQS